MNMMNQVKRIGVGTKKRVVRSIGGAEGGRTPDLRIANAALCQTELLPHAVVEDIR